jgi:hypothetical protein
MTRKSPELTDEFRERLREAGRRVHAIQREAALKGHGCRLCGPFVPIPQDLPYEEKLARSNEQWGIHAMHVRQVKARKARERRRQNGGG